MTSLSLNSYHQLQIYLRQCTSIGLKWPLSGIVLVIPHLPLYTTMLKTQNNNLQWRKGWVSHVYFTNV